MFGDQCAVTVVPLPLPWDYGFGSVYQWEFITKLRDTKKPLTCESIWAVLN